MPGRTDTHTYGARFIVPSLTSLGGDNNNGDDDNKSNHSFRVKKYTILDEE